MVGDHPLPPVLGIQRHRLTWSYSAGGQRPGDAVRRLVQLAEGQRPRGRDQRDAVAIAGRGLRQDLTRTVHAISLSCGLGRASARRVTPNSVKSRLTSVRATPSYTGPASRTPTRRPLTTALPAGSRKTPSDRSIPLSGVDLQHTSATVGVHELRRQELARRPAEHHETTEELAPTGAVRSRLGHSVRAVDGSGG